MTYKSVWSGVYLSQTSHISLCISANFKQKEVARGWRQKMTLKSRILAFLSKVYLEAVIEKRGM